jgi:hypothetical protein
VEYDRLICTPKFPSKADTSLIDDDDEVYASSDGQLLAHLVGEVSEVGLDEVEVGSMFDLTASDRKSRSSSIKRNAWPLKKSSVSKSKIVSK